MSDEAVAPSGHDYLPPQPDEVAAALVVQATDRAPLVLPSSDPPLLHQAEEPLEVAEGCSKDVVLRQQPSARAIRRVTCYGHRFPRQEPVLSPSKRTICIGTPDPGGTSWPELVGPLSQQKEPSFTRNRESPCTGTPDPGGTSQTNHEGATSHPKVIAGVDWTTLEAYTPRDVQKCGGSSGIPSSRHMK